VFLNLAQNSHRAVQSVSIRKLEITATMNGQRALISFQDSGHGVVDPHRLFQPFQEGADVTGLGLFISRVLIRSNGGELRHQPGGPGCSFLADVPLATTRKCNA
jgi:two-component system sensor kinase FixL